MKTSLTILMIHQHYFPEMTGTGRRTRELAECFVRNGHNVTVITSFPREFRSMPNAHCESYEILNNVNVYRIKTLFDIGNNVFFRMLSYASFVLQSLMLSYRKSRECQIIISIAPLSSGIIGALLQIMTKKYHHFDVPDILPDLGISAGMIKNKFIIYLMYKLEKWVYNHSSSVSAITHGQIDNIVNKGVIEEKISYIPDWVDDTFFLKNSAKYKQQVAKMLDYSNKILISFIGNIGALQNPEVFVEVMKSLDAEGLDDFQFLFIGDGIMLPSLKERVAEAGLQNITFVGRVEREYIPGYMHQSDILVANYLSNEYLDICIPGKLFEYAVSNKPIIMGSQGEAKNLIERYNLGIAVAPSNVNAFKEAILAIKDEKYTYNPDMEKFIDDYSLPKVVAKYNNIFLDIN